MSDVWVDDVSFRVRFPRLFDLSMYKEESVAEMCRLWWGMLVRRGIGGGGCLPGKRSWWGNLNYYFTMSLCRLKKKTGGYGIWKHLMSIPSVALTRCLLFNLWLLQWCLCHLFGIKTSLSRLFCLLGVCFGIGCRRRIIFSAMRWFLLVHSSVLLDVVQRRLLCIYFYIVISLVRYGTIYTGDSICRW